MRSQPRSRRNASCSGVSTPSATTVSLSVCAEGVETPEQLAFLRDRNCDRMQGHLLSEPLPAPRCLAFLDRWEADLGPLIAPRPV